MFRTVRLILLTVTLAVWGLSLPLMAQESQTLLDRVEERLHDVHEEWIYRPQYYPQEWLPDGSGYIVSRDESRWRVDVESGEETELIEGEPEPPEDAQRRSPDGTRVFEQRDGNLFVRSTDGGGDRQLTANERPDEVSYWGVSWSPDGRYLAFIEEDIAKVRVRTDLLGDEPTYPSLRESRFARVGGEIPRLRVGIAAVESAELRWVQLESSDEGFYLGQVEWAGDELLVEYLSRFRDRRLFLLANRDNGEVRTIFEESDPAWVVASTGVNLGLEWLDGGERFLVLHERSGWRHAYVHERNGKQLLHLTKGDFDIIDRASVDEEGGWFYFYAAPDNATQRYLYRVPLDGSAESERVTPADQAGTHSYTFAPDHRHAFHTHSSFDEPHVTELIELPSHRTVRVLEDNASLRNQIAEDGFRKTEFLQLDIGDDVTLDAWLMKPPNFDPLKKWPVLVYVYGEPHSQTVLDRWYTVNSDYHRVVSDLGYLILSIDNRGTPAPKGAAWRRAVFGSLGPLSTQEQAEALRRLGQERDYLDMSRVGIWGWSAGGSNTLNAMFRKPELYNVGIAVAAKPQPWLYNAWFQEMYMRTLEVNPEGYQQSAPIHFADGLEGDLLIVHGSGERNTHIQIVEGLVDRLIELGKRFDYMVYPHRSHGIGEGEGTTVHLRTLMIRYLLDHLEPGPR
jgi:dipeptidyl-peptidase 4